MSVIPKPKFPDVPKLPGVPQLVRATTAIQTAVLPLVNLGAGIAQLALSITQKPKWGIYDYRPPAPATEDIEVSADGELPEVVVTPRREPLPVIEATSIFRIGHMQEFTLPTNPIQAGSFATFNKIATPYEIELRMTKSGPLSERAKFLDDLERVGRSLDLYRIVTPERTYQPVNIASYSLNREGAEGAYFLTEVDIRVVEIRQVTPQYSTTQGDSGASTADAQDPSSLPTTNMGTLNGVTPPTDVQGKIERTLAPIRQYSNLFTG